MRLQLRQPQTSVGGSDQKPSPARYAKYIIALNSDIVNEMIKPFQSHGLLGERDIEKKVLDLPIPSFHPDSPAHIQIAELGRQARIEAKSFVKAAELPAGLARRRALVRKAVSKTLSQIDALVERLLVKQGPHND